MNVTIERAGERILVTSERPIPGLKQVIPGAYFRQSGGWSVPLDLETCQLLRERFGRSMRIGPILTAWAKVEKARRADLAKTAGLLDATLRRVPEAAPHLSKAMDTRTYQRTAARFVADARGADDRYRALIGDTVGLGKTIEALAAVVESGAPGPYLVVAPSTVVNSAWIPEIARWMPDAIAVSLPSSGYTRDKVTTSMREAREEVLDAINAMHPADLARTWLVIHPEAARTRSWWICRECGVETPQTAKRPEELDCGHPYDRPKARNDHEFPQLFSHEWGAVIADESDQMLVRLKGTPTQKRRGMECLGALVRPGGVRLAMSGTPWRSRPWLLWSTLNWLDPKAFPAYWRWVQLYWTLGGYGGYEIGSFIEERESMLMDSLKGIMLRRTRDDVRGDLPAKLYGGTLLDPADETSPKGVWLPMEGKQLKAYLEMESSAFANLEGGTLTALGHLAEMTRLKQFSISSGRLDDDEEFVPSEPSNKYTWILEKLREIGFPEEPSTKVVIVSQFTRVLNAFRGWLERDLETGRGRNRKTPEIGMITGDVSQVRRTAFIERFEDPADPLGIMLLNTKAGGAGITLDAAEIMIFLDETFIADDQEQAEGRIDNRQPEKRIVPRTYYYLRSMGSVEVGIATSNAESKRTNGKILDGARRVSEITRAAFQHRMERSK